MKREAIHDDMHSEDESGTSTSTASDSRKRRPILAMAGITKSISACKRCRLKKIKCDQEFPSCRKCAKAGVPCVSLDPATGRDVPRSYVMFLEDRLSAMMSKLKDCGVDPTTVQGNIPATSEDVPCNLELYEEKMRGEHQVPYDNVLAGFLINKGTSMQRGVSNPGSAQLHGEKEAELKDAKGESVQHSSPAARFSTDSITRSIELDESSKNVAAIGSMKNNASNSYLGDSSGISFAKLVFTAVNFRPDFINEESDEEIGKREEKYEQYADTESTTDFEPLWLPPPETADLLISQYFVDSNSQLPILHREVFLKKYYEPIYGPWNSDLSLASDNTEINSSFQLPKSDDGMEERSSNTRSKALEEQPWYFILSKLSEDELKEFKLPNKFKIPYFFLNMVFTIGHSVQVLKSDIQFLVSLKRRAVQFSNSLYGSPDRMEALAGTLLLATYSLMRPNIPGVWYTMGSALRLTIDLGLHAEKLNRNYDPFTRELRRRLFWCVYSLDRQICSYFGRPFGIPEENISASYPSLLDDALITTFNDNINDYSKVQTSMATSKVIALAMFKVRRIQANIVTVLYAYHGEVPRKYANLHVWREAMDRALDNWYHKEIPKTYKKMNCKFNTEYFKLNYYNTKTMLYGLSPKSLSLSDKAFEVVYENTKGTIDSYFTLCHKKKLNYTWVTVHNLFMAGMTYLYVIYYSDRGVTDGRLMAEDYTARLLFVLRELIGTCEAAKNCFIFYKVLSAAVLKLKFTMQHDDPKDQEENNKNTQTHNDTPAPVSVTGNVIAMSTNNSPTDSLRATMMEDPFEILRAKRELQQIGDVPLDEFFDELEKNTAMSDPESSKSHFSNMTSPERVIHSGVGSTTAMSNNENRHSRKSFPAKDGQKVMDILSQITTESIWDEFFGKSGMLNGNELPENFNFNNNGNFS